MTIHCYFGDYTSHKNEKKMLDQFLSQLQPVYGGTQDPWIYVIYNAMWNGHEVDVVCITQNSVIVTDLKNYSGMLSGQENGEWLIDTLDGQTIPVKGGGQINPFVQIRKNRYAIMEWLKEANLLQKDNMSHMAGLIVLTELSDLKTKFSHSVNRWFHVSDIPHIASTIGSIHSNEINIHESEASDVIQTLNLQVYDWSPAEPQVPRYRPFDAKPEDSNHNSQNRNTDLQQRRGSNANYNPPITPVSKKKNIYFPLAAIIIGCALCAGVVSANYFDIRDEVVHNIKKNASDSDMAIYNMVLRTKSLELVNTKYDLEAYGPNPESITKFNPNEQIWSTFQLIDLDKKTYYGFKIGETTFDQAKAQQVVYSSDNKVDKYYPHKTLTSIGYYYDENTVKLMGIKHKQFPHINIPNLSYIKMWFDQNDKLNAVTIYLDEKESNVLLPYIGRYKSLGYKVVEGSLATTIGFSYAVLSKGDEYVVLVDPHMPDVAITHTDKVTFEHNRESLLRKKSVSRLNAVNVL